MVKLGAAGGHAADAVDEQVAQGGVAVGTVESEVGRAAQGA